MKNSNHIFSFVGGDMLAKMGAWWFVSYSYYLHKDKTHRNWSFVKTEATRRSVFNRSKEYHVYWLVEVLHMERLDAQGNSGNLNAREIKRMAEELLNMLSKDKGETELQAILDKLKDDYERIKQK